MTIETRELRQQVPSTIMDALDGLALANGQTRTDLVNAILQQHTDKAVHDATVLLRYVRGNGSSRSASE